MNKYKNSNQIILLMVGVLLAFMGFLIGKGFAKIESETLSIATSSVLFFLSGLLFFIFFKRRDEKATFAIVLLLLVLFWYFVAQVQFNKSFNKSLSVEGGEITTAKVCKVTVSLRTGVSISYEFIGNGTERIGNNTFWPDKGNKELESNDTILILYSIDNPKMNRIYDLFPSKEKIEKYKDGVYINPKKIK